MLIIPRLQGGGVLLNYIGELNGVRRAVLVYLGGIERIERSTRAMPRCGNVPAARAEVLYAWCVFHGDLPVYRTCLITRVIPEDPIAFKPQALVTSQSFAKEQKVSNTGLRARI